MSFITVDQANAWAEKTKLAFTSIDNELETSVVEQVFAKIRSRYDVSSWTDEQTTPSLVLKIIAMMYVGWYYERTYSEDENVDSYGLLLLERAENLIEGILAGTTIIPDIPVAPSALSYGNPSFYPNDTVPPAFTMGKIW